MQSGQGQAARSLTASHVYIEDEAASAMAKLLRQSACVDRRSARTCPLAPFRKTQSAGALGIVP